MSWVHQIQDLNKIAVPQDNGKGQFWMNPFYYINFWFCFRCSGQTYILMHRLVKIVETVVLKEI